MNIYLPVVSVAFLSPSFVLAIRELGPVLMIRPGRTPCCCRLSLKTRKVLASPYTADLLRFPPHLLCFAESRVQATYALQH